MKKMLFTLLLAAAMLAGCTEEIDEMNLPEQLSAIPEEYPWESDSTAALTEAETDTMLSPAETEKFPEIVLPKIVYSIRDTDLELIPEGLVTDEKFTGYLSTAIFEQTGIGEITARITILQNSQADGLKYIFADYEAYPTGAEICEKNCLYFMNVGLELNESGLYSPGTPMIIDEEGPSLLQENYEEFIKSAGSSAESDCIFLDNDSRICFRRGGTTAATTLSYKGSIYDLEKNFVIESSGNVIAVISREDSFYSTPLKISLSRDGGSTWTTHTPELEPLGKNNQHLETGFSAAKIQIMPDGQIYFFIGTNLASMTVMTIEPDGDNLKVLFREQIDGYETTALVDAAMVNETRGFYTLTHPKETICNAIYRTTDGGENWVRCSVPVPKEAKKHFSMKLYLPYQPEGTPTSVWYMKGEWDTGECLYVSEDGGWTWAITETP